AEGRPPKFPVGSEPTLVRSACQPPITDPPDGMLTIALPPPVPLIPGLTALMPTLYCPMADTFVALTCTGPVVELAQMPRATSPNVEIAPGAVIMTAPPGCEGLPFELLRNAPLSSTMPSEPVPFVVIGPDELIVILPLPPKAEELAGPFVSARMPMPPPPLVVMPEPV